MQKWERFQAIKMLFWLCKCSNLLTEQHRAGVHFRNEETNQKHRTHNRSVHTVLQQDEWYLCTCEMQASCCTPSSVSAIIPYLKLTNHLPVTLFFSWVVQRCVLSDAWLYFSRSGIVFFPNTPPFWSSYTAHLVYWKQADAQMNLIQIHPL